jgi:teichoic acid transport system ATP-binding protein
MSFEQWTPKEHMHQNSSPDKAAEKKVVISVRNLSKYYRIYNNPISRIKELVVLGRRPFHRKFYALRDVSFEVVKGECVGIMGKNGSGKSTLLQSICGTLTPTSGIIKVQGRVSALLELGTGFNPEFTGQENVYMNAAILGLSNEEIDARYNAIVEFADIGDFVYQPVKKYSSGMFIRLAFATAISVDPEILLVDEALAVGDYRFQRKCYQKIEELRENGKTILFVSHNMDTINLLCDKAILLDNGRIIDEGEPKWITKLYHKILFGSENESRQEVRAREKGKQARERQEFQEIEKHEDERAKDKIAKKSDLKQIQEDSHQKQTDEMRYGNKKAEIIDFGILDESKERVTLLEAKKNYTIFLKAHFNESSENPILGILINDTRGVVLFGTNTSHQKIEVPPQKRGSILEGQFNINMWLAPGKYFLTVIIGKHGDTYDARLDALPFEVFGNCKIFPNSKVNLEPKVTIVQ